MILVIFHLLLSYSSLFVMHHIRKFVMPKKQVRIEDSNPRFKQLCLHSRRYVAIDRPENVLSEK